MYLSIFWNLYIVENISIINHLSRKLMGIVNLQLSPHALQLKYNSHHSSRGFVDTHWHCLGRMLNVIIRKKLTKCLIINLSRLSLSLLLCVILTTKLMKIIITKRHIYFSSNDFDRNAGSLFSGITFGQVRYSRALVYN